jgi:hypothetical protein
MWQYRAVMTVVLITKKEIKPGQPRLKILLQVLYNRVVSNCPVCVFLLYQLIVLKRE